MLGKGARPYHDVIEVDVTDATDPCAERSRNAALMDGGCISDSHGDDHPFVQSPRRVDRGEGDIVRVHMGLEKTVRHIDGGEDHTLRTIGKDFVDPWQREGVCHRIAVELAIIVYPSGKDCRVRLWDDERS